MIDWRRIEELRSEVGEEALAEIVALFLDEVETTVQRLQRSPDPRRYEADLHFLKGSAVNLGFADLGALCQAGESRAALGDPSGVNIGQVTDAYFRSKRHLLDGLDSRGIRLG